MLRNIVTQRNLLGKHMNKSAGRIEQLRVDLARRKITIEDGERKDEWRLSHVKRASRAYGRSWNIVWHGAAERLAQEAMTPAASRLLWHVLARWHPTTWQRLTHREIAEAAGLDRSATTKALAELERLRCIERGALGYRLHIELAWQGTAQAYQAERRKRSAASAPASSSEPEAEAKPPQYSDAEWRAILADRAAAAERSRA